MLRIFTVALVLIAGSALGAERFPAGQLSDDAIPTHYALDLTIVPSEATFSGRVAIDVRLKAPSDVIWLHGKGLRVSKATVRDANGSEIAATWAEIPDSDGVAKLTLTRPAQGPSARIEIAYTAPYNTQLEGLYRSVDAGEAYIFSQMEAISARVAFPSFDDPRFKTPYDTTLTVPTAHAAISNTPEIQTEAVAGGMKRVRFATTKPLPTYLIAIIVGPFDVVEWQPVPISTVRDRVIPLRGIATKGKGPRLSFALANTAGLLLKLEDYFGIAYPFEKLDIIAATDFSAGAMENAGAIVYREGLLLLDDTASLAQKRRYVSVHAHEMAHQWVGDLVTPVWWNDIWLNEAFATWMSDKTAAAWDPKGEYDRSTLRGALGAMGDDSMTDARRIAQPIETNDDIENAFDSITYEKGGGVLSMFEQYYGTEAFRKGVHLHLTRHAFGSATASDFLQSVADANSDTKGVAAFQSFLNQPGVPVVNAELRCGKENSIAVRQSRYQPKLQKPVAQNQTWKIPLCVSYGSGTAREQTCRLVEERTSVIPLKSCPVWIMPNADGAGYYRFALGRKGWAALTAASDTLTDKEMLAVFDSLEASVAAGQLDIGDYLDNLKVLMKRKGGNVTWDGAGALIPRLIWIKNVLASEQSTPRVEKFITDLYGPLYDKLGLDPTSDYDRDNPVQAALLRGPVVSMVAVEGRAPAPRAELAKRGAAYLGIGANGVADGKLHPEAINANLVDQGLTVVVKERGAPAVDAILTLLKTERDGTLRSRLLSALTRSTDPALAARVRDLAFDDSLRVNELPTIVYGATGERQNLAAGWAWFKQNYDKIKERTPSFGQSGLAEVGYRFCSEAERADYEAFFHNRARDLTGGQRVFAMTLESIDHCVALTGSQRARADAYFRGR